MTKMNRKNLMSKSVAPRNAVRYAIASALFGSALLSSAPMLAQDRDYEQVERQRLAAEEQRLRSEEARIAAEKQREEAELVAEEQRLRREQALMAVELRREEAELAAESARLRAEELRAETERLRDEAQMNRETMREEQAREFARVREELSRTHQELRRASQEVARAHRDLALAEDRSVRTRVINLGDRAMLGVILGGPIQEGIRIVGVSPDGPAERAGIQTGDVLVSIRGESLAQGERRRAARDVVYEVMSDLGENEEILVEVLRDGERLEFMVKPDKREPTSWASYIRLPAAPAAPSAPSAPGFPTAPAVSVAPSSPSAPGAPSAPTAPESPEILLGTLDVPPVDAVALIAEAELLAEEFEQIRMVVADGTMPPGYAFEYEFGEMDFTFDEQAFSEIGAQALSEASVWFGTPATLGVRFTELNPGLGAYFGAEQGVLVLDAPEDNALQLKAGDVIVRIGGEEIRATADVVRALRDYETGDTVTLAIRRNQRDEDLSAIMPENRLGFISREFIQSDGEVEIMPEIATE